MAKPPNSMAIMAIDPGKTIGIAYVRMERKNRPSSIAYHVVQAEVPDDMDFYDKYEAACRDLKTTIASFMNTTYSWGVEERAIVVEDFVLRGGTMLSDRDALGPVVMISMLHDFLSSLASASCRIELQMPGMKETVSNQRLQNTFMYHRGVPHAMDALRHALVYARTRGYAGAIAHREARPASFWA